MACFANPNLYSYCRHQPLHLSFNHHRPCFPKLTSSLSFRTSPFKLSSIRASSSSYEPQKPSLLQPLTPLLKATCISITAAAAVFYARFHQKPALASLTAMPTVATETNVSLHDQEKALQQKLAKNPNDVETLRSLMEVRIKLKKLQQSIEVINRLIQLEPQDPEWPMLKAQIHSYAGDFDLAKKEFEDILAKDPDRVEAFHGLVMAYSDSGQKLKELEKRIEKAMAKSKKENKNKDFRDFKLLIAQIRVIEGKHTEALKVYEALVKEEPMDFRPYLCMGIIYTLLKKKNEAEKQFDKFKKLVPKDYPYREYFVDNMLATKLFPDSTSSGKR